MWHCALCILNVCVAYERVPRSVTECVKFWSRRESEEEAEDLRWWQCHQFWAVRYVQYSGVEYVQYSTVEYVQYFTVEYVQYVLWNMCNMLLCNMCNMLLWNMCKMLWCIIVRNVQYSAVQYRQTCAKETIMAVWKYEASTFQQYALCLVKHGWIWLI